MKCFLNIVVMVAQYLHVTLKKYFIKKLTFFSNIKVLGKGYYFGFSKSK